ncbi:predicted protein [Micromonas commoda]|uniref:Uncharacterized protein n=1 Tax=Micromonas commoda (strain RCC299 / NOUM17 / CCMP2709) TaxID=296587 RepID=C1FGN8_MICCC|nr:predicted protein [Micromonas commoda]ACO69575.1 predicted protein [Micromonas commoda]|eukprot:XP_002508317.1 predicted protein [Micromonas commoda]
MSPGDAGGAPAGEGSAPSPSSRPSANNDDAVSSVAPDGTIDPMVAEAEQSALTLLRRELAASRRATERERLVAKRACEQLAAERAASAEREEELMTLEARLEALTEGRESAREEAFRREASPSSSPPDDDDDDDDDARRATSPPAAAELFKTPHAAADEEEEEEEEEDGEVFVASGVPPSRGRGTLDPRAVAAAEALLARADALEHEHAREIAALNARVRALERALSSAEGAAAVAEAAAAEALRQQSRMATHQTAAALRRREREEAEAEATISDLKRRLERERERADAWKARAIAAESKAAKAAAEAEQLCAQLAAAQLRADSARTSQTSRVTFEEKVASSASFAADGGSELAKGPFSRKLANGRRVRVGSPSSTTPGDAGRRRLGSLGRSTAAPSARLAIALAARGGKGGRLDVSESRDAFRASLRRQGEALARLAAGRVARRAEMAALRDAVDAMGVT